MYRERTEDTEPFHCSVAPGQSTKEYIKGSGGEKLENPEIVQTVHSFNRYL